MGDATTTLSELSVRELTARLSSGEPIPGGGSAAALAGAMGAALVSMVVELTAGRPDAAEHADALRDLGEAAVQRVSALLDLAEDDAVAYAAVVRARHLPKEGEAEREARARALRTAMVEAARVPLRTAEVAAEVLGLAHAIAPIGNRNAASDAGVAAQLAAASVRGALLNVRINLPYLAADEPLRTSAPADITRLERLAREQERETLHVVGARIEPS
jgi:formiminotetrahydrofolate cyclodeaminase